MATIATGISKTFSIPGIPWSRIQPQMHRACVDEPLKKQAYSQICNIAWKGSTNPNILWASKVLPQSWAECRMGGWGKGIVYFTSATSLAKRMTTWSDDTWMGLCFHEMGHLLLNTWNQDIGYPPKAWVVNALVKHYGKPKPMLAAEEVESYAAFASPVLTELSLWDRIRLKFVKPIYITEVNGDPA